MHGHPKTSFPVDDFLDFIQLVESLNRGQVVDIQILDFVPDLTQNGIVQLEETQLIGTVRLDDTPFCWGDALLPVLPFQLFQDLIGPFHNRARHARHFGDMNTKAVFTTTGHQFTQENHLVVHLFDRYIVVLDEFEGAFNLVELMIVGGKERFGPTVGMLVDILDNGPGNRDSVIGAGSSAQLVEQH